MYTFERKYGQLELKRARVLLAGNDTVPIAVWRGGGIHVTECLHVRYWPLVSGCYLAGRCAFAAGTPVLVSNHPTSPRTCYLSVTRRCKHCITSTLVSALFIF